MDRTVRSADWPRGDGEMARLIRGLDWTSAPLGVAGAWTPELRVVAELMLASPLVSTLAIGPERVLLYNDAAARLYDGRHPAALGRPLSETWPEAYDTVAPLYDRAFAGEAVQVPAQPLDVSRAGGEMFEATLTPVRSEDGGVLAVHMIGVEVSGRVRAEASLRESEERQAFLLGLSDVLRPLGDPAAIGIEAMRRLGQHLDVSRAQYWEAQGDGEHVATHGGYFDDLPAFVGRVRMADFGSFVKTELSAGRTLRMPDARTAPHLAPAEVTAHETMGVRAYLGVPLVKDGRLVALLGLHDSGPRDWTPQEVTLAADVAERTWAAVERARAEAAVAKSEEMLREFGEASSDVLWIRDAETLEWTYLTPAFEAIYGLGRDEALSGDTFINWVDLILPEDRDHATKSIARVRAGERVTFEYRIRRPKDGEVRWLRNTDFPIWGPDGQVESVGGVGHDITEMKRAEAVVARSEAALRLTALRLTSLVEGIPQLVWRAVDHGLWTWASPQWTAFTGQPEAASHGWGWLDALHPDDRDAARAAWERSRETDELHAEYRLREAETGAYRWFQTSATPVRDEAGALVEWLGTTTDVQDLREMQDRLRILVAELQHRTRNLMGVVLGVMRRTLRGEPDPARFAADFQSRLEALARVQGLLSQLDENDRVAFDKLLRAELSAMGALDPDGFGPQVALEGPKGVRLRSSTVQTFALAIHELATNATKYGALSQRDGRLAVRWRRVRLAGGPGLRVEWTERGVAMPEPHPAPRGGGYGRELIERALPYQLGAETSFEMTGDGVRCTITVPLSSTTERTDA